MSDDMIKIAREYDSAGRLMARGFVDEFNKLAYNLNLDKLAKSNCGPKMGTGKGARYGTGAGMCKGCKKPMGRCTCK